MNAKTAKLIRRYSSNRMVPLKATRWKWNHCPKRLRHLFRREMQDYAPALHAT